jgi:AcrR family transcriptional regulator
MRAYDAAVMRIATTSAMANEIKAKENYRTAVARQRRARTEARILEAALHIFAEQGLEAPTIDEFIKAAGVARGTFYNYFKSTHELLAATWMWLTEDLVESIEKEISVIHDPVIRHGMGMRYWMHKAKEDAPWCRFVATTWYGGSFGGAAEVARMRNIRLGMKSGGIRCSSPEVAYDLMMGTMRQAMLRLTQKPNLRRTDYGEEIIRSVLVALSVDPAKIEDIMSRPVTHMRRPTRTVA